MGVGGSREGGDPSVLTSGSSSSCGHQTGRNKTQALDFRVSVREYS